MARILLITDHKWRDLPGNTFLKLFMEQKYGHSVLLVRLNEERLFAPTFKPDMVIYNNLYTPEVNRYARYLHDKGVKVVILPTEGITFSDEQTLLFCHKYAGIEFIDAYIAWNKLMADAIVKNNVLSDDKVTRIGCCRFDFYSDELAGCRNGHDYFNSRYSIPKGNKNILITTNFANAEFWPEYSFLQKDLERQRAKGIKTFSDAGELAKHEHDYRSRVFIAIHELCRQLKNINIIIKYHPSEKVSVYHDLIMDLKELNPNVYLVEGEYIWDVLNVSDVVIQRCSTVAVEAWLMGKQTVELELMPNLDHFLQPRYKEGSHVVINNQQLVETVRAVLKNSGDIDGEMLENRRRILNYVISNSAGGATGAIAQYINSVLHEAQTIENLRYDSAISKVKYWIRRIFGMKGYTFIANLWKLRVGDYLGRFDKSFSKKDQQQWEKRLQRYVENA